MSLIYYLNVGTRTSGEHLVQAREQNRALRVPLASPKTIQTFRPVRFNRLVILSRAHDVRVPDGLCVTRVANQVCFLSISEVAHRGVSSSGIGQASLVSILQTGCGRTRVIFTVDQLHALDNQTANSGLEKIQDLGQVLQGSCASHGQYTKRTHTDTYFTITRVYIYIYIMCIYIDNYIIIYIHCNMYTRVYSTYITMCMYIYISLSLYVYVYMYICIYVYMYM